MSRPRYPDGSPKPSARAKRAVGLVLSGKAESLRDAAKRAGYAQSTANKASVDIFRTKGVVNYLKRIDKVSRDKWGVSIQDKVMGTLFESLDATKLFGKKGKEHPDYRTRIEAADRFAKFFKWDQEGVEDKGKQFNQFNFFQVDPKDQKAFHKNLKELIKKSYT